MHFLAGALGPAGGLVAAVFVAWRAADFLEAEHQLMAVLLAAALAFAGPLLVGEQITALLAEASTLDNAGLRSLADAAGESRHLLVGTGMKLGFAMCGVLIWCGIERAR